MACRVDAAKWQFDPFAAEMQANGDIVGRGECEGMSLCEQSDGSFLYFLLAPGCLSLMFCIISLQALKI